MSRAAALTARARPLRAYHLKNIMPQWRLTTICNGMFEFMFIQVIRLAPLLLVPEVALRLPWATRRVRSAGMRRSVPATAEAGLAAAA